ncbi:hypothetical protein HY407_01785 [Candidatus Gottesmanbacteria bacterium]|nr:hypothetical protein [Candidatus Gottesmanbacteria bacterium]
MKKRSANFYLITDLLSCFPDNVERNLLNTLHSYTISKDTIESVFKEEIKNPKPRYRVLYGALLVYADYLRYHQRIAYYEVLPLLPQFKFCLSYKNSKNIRKVSSQNVMMLFGTLYFEFCMLPVHYKEDLNYIRDFRKHISREELLHIISKDIYGSKFFFRQNFLKVDYSENDVSFFEPIVNEFYSKKLP